MVENALEITGLKKTYAAQRNQAPKVALKGIDLAIPKGSIFGLLGPNGAGKSTLINILAGLVVKSAGNVKIWGFDQNINPRQSRASIGVMPQELNMDPFFSPREALEVQAGLYGVPKSKRKSDEILEMIGLTDKADAYARSLSGGMKRRLLLGKALVHHPDILVLDEPTAGVDIEIRQMLWDNVRKLNQQGMTIILTTHYLEEAEEMCDEIGIINHGELIVREDTKTMVGRLDTKTLVIVPDRSAAEYTPPKDTTLTRRADGSLAISYKSTTTSASEILDSLRDANITIRDVRTEEPDLEDAFLALTAK
ncbi:ABC transporter ATP-binding protein [Falsihalocynthiibacter sp. CO-5D18]